MDWTEGVCHEPDDAANQVALLARLDGFVTDAFARADYPRTWVARLILFLEGDIRTALQRTSRGELDAAEALRRLWLIEQVLDDYPNGDMSRTVVESLRIHARAACAALTHSKL